MRLRRWSSGERSGLCCAEISAGAMRDPPGSADGVEQRRDVRGGVRQREGQHRTAVLGEHAGVARRLRGDELAEGERTIGDLEVVAVRPR